MYFKREKIFTIIVMVRPSMLEWNKVHMRYKEVRSESLALSHNRKISCEELARHNTGGDCWMSFQGNN